MKKLILFCLATLSFHTAFASCQDFEGVGAISTSSTSPWFLTTYITTGTDILSSCKITRELRQDIQTAAVDGVMSNKLTQTLLTMKQRPGNTDLTNEQLLEKLSADVTAFEQ